MKKGIINIEEAERIYKECGSLHKAAKILHTSHIRLSKFFSENNISINNVGKSRVLSDEEISNAINDYVERHMTMADISKKYNVRIHKLRVIFKSNNVVISKWNGHVKKEKPIRIKKEKKKEAVETKKCPYCNWETKDIFGKAHSYQKHLVHHHHIDIDKHLLKYPEDYSLIKDEKIKREKKIQCMVCGKWRHIIDNRHLAKHGMTKSEYMAKFYGYPVISETTKDKLHDNMEKMMNNNEWERKTSTYEHKIEDFLKKNNIEYVKHDREVLNGLELDFIVGNIAIEFNGNKYHTEWFGKKDRYYHLNKTEICNKKGIKLLQIFEDEYKQHEDIVYSKLSHIIGNDRLGYKIAGRKCRIVETRKDEAYTFLEKNHIQGFVNSSVYIGATYNNELIAVMTFINEGNNKWNLTRFASKNGYICQGVGGKLFKWFIRKYNPQEVKSFADRRWTLDKCDNLYTKLQFKLDKILPPDYRYYNEKVDKYTRFHKFNFRKQMLHKKYGLPLTMTESEMVKELGYDRIWDCGLFKYVWRRGD